MTYMMRIFLLGFPFLLTMNEPVTALVCKQCNGWHGQYPGGQNIVSTCDNRNNKCETSQYCVKIIDSMEPGSTYVTYKSDCYYSSSIQVSPTNLSSIQSKGCYPYQDSSTPPKRWWYCFCNDRDFCNTANRFSIPAFLLFIVLPTYVL